MLMDDCIVVRNHSWLSRANGQFLREFRADERKVIEKYIKLAHNSYAKYSTLLENPNSVRVECTMRQHDHWLHKKIGFFHVIDVLSIIGVGVIALTASGIAMIFGRSDGTSDVDGSVIETKSRSFYHSRSPTTSSLGKAGLSSPTRRSFFLERFDEKRIA
ncbi:hypothetical protein L218DRAFT_686738 [Marasmius fiardii PR-910]|nr:hypothetical protein L218DRAFT_686738 [Marasmius fiardii PR-910]